MTDVHHISPEQEAFLSYWVSKCDDTTNAIPNKDQLGSEETRNHLPWTVIFEQKENPKDFQYHFIGTEVTPLIHTNYTGKLLSTIPGKGPDSQIWKFLDFTLKSNSPHIRTMPYVGPLQSISHVVLVSLPLAPSGDHSAMVWLMVDFVKWPFLEDSSDTTSKVAALKKMLTQTNTPSSYKSSHH